MRRITTVMAAAVMVMALAGRAIAQQGSTVEVSLPEQQRQGSFTSGSLYVDPALTLLPYIIVRPVINAGDFVDPAKSFVVILERFDAALGIWRHVTSADWRGGQPLPGICITSAEARGQRFRFVLDVPVRMRIGASIFDSLTDLEG